MFFVASKLIGPLTQPQTIVALLLVAGVICLLAGWRKRALALVVSASTILIVSGWTTLGALMLHPLENRFARPAQMPERVDGIILLGGGFEGHINLQRGGYDLNASGDRLVEAAALAFRYPEAMILVSGGSGALLLEGEGDADTAPRFFSALGIPAERLILEGQSRNTAENAALSRAAVVPSETENWILVTSAFHMPRSIGLYRKAGFRPIPWPVDYRSGGNEGLGLARNNSLHAIGQVGTALREWSGLLAYYLSGRLDELLPSPE